MVQLRCPETGKPMDLGDVPPDAVLAAVLYSKEIPCPHCGKAHPWTSWHDALVLKRSRPLQRRAGCSSRATRQPHFRKQHSHGPVFRNDS
jgi:hypothetical protein